MNEEGNKPAFPIEKWGNYETQTCGITKREYFAAVALQGVMHFWAGSGLRKDVADDAAKAALNFADSLLELLYPGEKNDRPENAAGSDRAET